jgi:alcohol dehydrogenase class IV
MHGYLPVEGGDHAFSVDASNLTFGRGCLSEVGALAQQLGGHRVALFTDPVVETLPFLARVKESLRAAGIEPVVYAETHVEPTDASFLEAARFYLQGRFDGAVSVGGGSVMDTAKAALLYSTWPADFLTYVNAPVGRAQAVPGPLPWHIACPTTSGTGAELTGIAVCDLLALKAKTGIASRRLRPTLAVVDPDVTATLPNTVVAASGFDVLCHALESYTARPYSRRPKPAGPALRPMSQGANPFSDLGSLEALRKCGRFLVRATHDASDAEAREEMMWAATMAGIAFGNAGVHVPHAMAYAVSGLVRGFHLDGYPAREPMVPHGLSVVVSAPTVFRWTASSDPGRHLEAAVALGADVRGAAPEDAGEVVGALLEKLLAQTKLPANLGTLGYEAGDVAALVRGTAMQRRLLDNAPRTVREGELQELFEAALVRT